MSINDKSWNVYLPCLDTQAYTHTCMPFLTYPIYALTFCSSGSKDHFYDDEICIMLLLELGKVSWNLEPLPRLSPLKNRHPSASSRSKHGILSPRPDHLRWKVTIPISNQSRLRFNKFHYYPTYILFCLFIYFP